MRFKFFSFLLLSMAIYADPWGKDADLCFSLPHKCNEKKDSLGVWLSEKMIQFHQDLISPADGPRSHFIPSSSQYTLEAIQKFGFCKGWMYGCDRLMRENSEKWVYKVVKAPNGTLMKWDPVK